MSKNDKKGGYYSEIIEVLCSVAVETDRLRVFMDDLLTQAEQDELGLRWQIVKLLHSGKTQREVASALEVSIATVTRGAGVLKKKDGGFTDVLNRKRASGGTKR